MTTPRGFSLVELMVTVTVVAILAAIAYPSYMEYTRRSQRVQAMGLLLQAADLLERNRTQTGSYKIDPVTNKQISLGTQPPIQGNPLLGFYNFGNVINDNDFTLIFTPIKTQTADKCGTLSLTNAGVRTAKKNNVLVPGCWGF